MRGRDSHSEINYRWKNVVIMLSIMVAGFFAITMSSALPSETAKHIVTTCGESLLVGGLLGFAFELLLRRDILHMMFDMREQIDANKRWGQVASDLGLADIHRSDREMDAAGMLQDAKHLTIIMNDGRTWLSSHEGAIEARLARSDCSTTLYLVHPESPHLQSLSRKVDADLNELRDKIQQTIRLVDRHHRNGHRLRVFGHFLPASYSLIHSESLSCQIPYPIGRKVEQLPVFVFARRLNGGVYDLISRDIETIHKHAAELYPNPQMVAQREEAAPIARRQA